MDLKWFYCGFIEYIISYQFSTCFEPPLRAVGLIMVAEDIRRRGPWYIHVGHITQRGSSEEISPVRDNRTVSVSSMNSYDIALFPNATEMEQPTQQRHPG